MYQRFALSLPNALRNTHNKVTLIHHRLTNLKKAISSGVVYFAAFKPIENNLPVALYLLSGIRFSTLNLHSWEINYTKHLYHVIQNTPNQNTGYRLYIKWYCTCHVLRLCRADCAGPLVSPRLWHEITIHCFLEVSHENIPGENPTWHLYFLGICALA